MLEWKKIIIDGIETNYSVSNEGEVKNDKTNRKMTLGFHQGYRTVGLKVNGKNKGLRVHRLVANVFIPNPEKKPYVNHIDGNRGNNKLENLEWVTPSENTQHAVRIGLMVPSRERSVIQFGLDGKRIAEFKSISEACRITNSLNETFGFHLRILFAFEASPHKLSTSVGLKNLGLTLTKIFPVEESIPTSSIPLPCQIISTP